MRKRTKTQSTLSPLENEIMEIFWRLGSASAEEIREALRSQRDLKDSTIRTLLRRMEAKGVLEHTIEGRTYIYRSSVQPAELANQAIRRIIRRFCQDSIPSLLIGMANDKMITPKELRSLAAQIEDAEKKKRGSS